MISLALLAAVVLDAASIAQTSATLNALGPHPFGSPRNRVAAEFVEAKLKEAGLAQTALEEFVFQGEAGANVVARLQGRTDRLLIIATHHDSGREAQDVSDRSRSLSLLIEMGRQAASLRPARTWILASFDGGESNGQGLSAYLEALGKSKSLVDGVLLIDAASQPASEHAPSLIAPACRSGGDNGGRAIAGRDLVAAALGGVPASLDVSFDDPGISLLTQPFIRAFVTRCSPNAARAMAAGLGVIMATETSYSRSFINRPGAITPTEPGPRDTEAARLGEVAFAALLGIDGSTPSSPQSDSWLVAGRAVWPGWLIFLIGLLTLIPGLMALRSDKARLPFRIAYSVLFAIVLYFEPEIALFAGLLPNLLPPSVPGRFLGLTFIPLALLVAAGALGFARGQVTGSWLSIWMWLGLATALGLLYASAGRGKKAPARAKRGKR